MKLDLKKCFFWIGFAIHFLIGPGAFAERSVLQPYRTDACTTPAGVGKESWTECCTSHDFGYWVGGSLDDKRRVDAQLIQCLRSKEVTGKIAADIFKLLPEFITKKHWGNRWVPPRGDAPLTEEEIGQVKKYEPSFQLPFPIVKDTSGEKCQSKITIALKDITYLKSFEKLLCFDLVKKVKDKLESQELVYSDDCLDFFIVTINSGEAQNVVEGFGACAKWIKSSHLTSETARLDSCVFSVPPMKGYREMLEWLKLESR